MTWAERPLPGDAHLIAALHLLFDLALDWQPGAERLLELLRRGGSALQLARERQPAAGRDDGRLEAIANGHFERPVATLSSASAIVASPLPPTSTNATSGPIATIVPSTCWPFSNRFVAPTPRTAWRNPLRRSRSQARACHPGWHLALPSFCLDRDRPDGVGAAPTQSVVCNPAFQCPESQVRCPAPRTAAPGGPGATTRPAHARISGQLTAAQP